MIRTDTIYLLPNNWIWQNRSTRRWLFARFLGAAVPNKHLLCFFCLARSRCQLPHERIGRCTARAKYPDLLALFWNDPARQTNAAYFFRDSVLKKLSIEIADLVCLCLASKEQHRYRDGPIWPVLYRTCRHVDYGLRWQNS